MTDYTFYDNIDKMEELVLENFLDNDIFNSPNMTWYEERDDEEDIDEECYCENTYEYCECDDCIDSEILEDDFEWTTVQYRKNQIFNEVY